MDDRTREYLRGRFGDYYRSVSLSLPPDANLREWGHIPWTPGSGTTMVRHQSLYDLGDVDTFFADNAPRHAYFSAARYDDPGATTMGQKGWRNADLVFDLDADHLPGVDPETTSYPEMLAACKDALVRLLDFIDDDFAFEDVTVVFSGGRGYHVHVRDESVRELDSEARREIVDYVRAIDLDSDGLIRTVSDRGTTKRVLRTEGGWGARVHDALVEYADDLREMGDEAARERLMELDGIGEGRAETIRGAFDRNPTAVREGNVEAGGPGVRRLVSALAARVAATDAAPIDEPVTTDTRRLIRLPGTLHGGSALVVTPLDRDELADFDPLRDAVPDRFVGREIRIETDADRTVELNGERVRVESGRSTVPEFAGAFLMARGEARKAPER
ncbi:DNA primase small subunit PriS [Halorubrum ezzemoulense]|uniref:DNA primase small subunit PriS n=1 Tax=Halorubrum ezzemoulense TaxID=337243 RepID=UPI00232FA72F|nr:DNA primase small subunit PriS [Halorubrum ezzemoulense]MDB9248697.1 DNA primase small subunit PriS [Halorubrum ezzemoulense]MDB9258965.1 DNA primase small subunit PriS [Halorubrum ezzemoulense]MDB9262456.1 DNA primase small subunit PriS [Halorubrum ezzemoulense]MDB9265984.1 DNA primase small subunit PriS [Halorubrum ezzemoulense]MDB9269326.1 DNA primase small subunit PriS [Halorubrum ezzemoulense]